MHLYVAQGDLLRHPADALVLATHSTVPNRDGPGTLLGNVGEAALRMYGDELESVVGQIDPFPLGHARIEPADDVDLPWKWVVLIGTLDVVTVDRAVRAPAGRLLSAFEQALRAAARVGAAHVVSPLQRGGARLDWQRAFGVMVQAAERLPGELGILERHPEHFENLARLAPSFGVEVRGWTGEPERRGAP